MYIIQSVQEQRICDKNKIAQQYFDTNTKWNERIGESHFIRIIAGACTKLIFDSDTNIVCICILVEHWRNRYSCDRIYLYVCRIYFRNMRHNIAFDIRRYGTFLCSICNWKIVKVFHKLYRWRAYDIDNKNCYLLLWEIALSIETEKYNQFVRIKKDKLYNSIGFSWRSQLTWLYYGYILV